MIFMLAPAPNMPFGGMPSGNAYESNQYGLIFTSSTADQIALMQAGCATLTPFSAYPLPPPTAWKLGATGCFAPTNLPDASNGVTTSINMKGTSCRVHFATCEWSGTVMLVFSNWCNQVTVGDYYDNAGLHSFGPVTVDGTICYPNNTTVIGTFSGVVNPGQDIQIPVQLSASVPQGGKVFIGTYWQTASGCGCPLISPQSVPIGGETSGVVIGINAAIGEAAEIGSSATDKTHALNTVTSNPSASFSLYGPTAILAVQPISTPVLAVNGASDHYGWKAGDGPGAEAGAAPYFNDVSWLAMAANTAGPTVACLNTSVTGKSARVDAAAGFSGTGFANATSARERLMATCGVTHAGQMLGSGDIYSGTSAATTEASMTTLFARWAAHGWYVVAQTLMPETTSTDNWATTANQSVLTTQAALDTYNTWIRSIPTNVSLMVDMGAAMADTGTAANGVWNPHFTPDGIHQLQAALPAALSAVPAGYINAIVPAQQLGYGDTYNRGLKNVQAALDFALNPQNMGHEILLGVLNGANFNSTADQAIALNGPALYEITSIVVIGGATSLTTAQGGFYSAANKTGALLGTTSTTPYTGLTSAAVAQNITGGTGLAAVLSGASTIYMSLTTPEGSAAVGTVFVFGKRLAT